jgi:hypothetical protein
MPIQNLTNTSINLLHRFSCVEGYLDDLSRPERQIGDIGGDGGEVMQSKHVGVQLISCAEEKGSDRMDTTARPCLPMLHKLPEELSGCRDLRSSPSVDACIEPDEVAVDMVSLE